MLWAAAAAVAALAVFIVLQVTDDGATSIAPAQTEFGSTFSEGFRQAEANQAPVMSESLASANPAAASATGQSSASASQGVNPAQAGAISGPATGATVPAENGFMGLPN
jgi:hypothetical protein